MYYDDQGRRFNVLSGLIFGTVLGAGVALLMVPHARISAPVPARRLARDWKRRGVRAVGGGRARLLESVVDTLSDAWTQASGR